MRLIFRLNGWLVQLLCVLAVVVVAAMALGVSAEVILRMFKFSSISGLIELTEYGLFISTFFIAPYLLRTGEHIRVDIAMSRHQTEFVAHHAAWLGDTGQDVFMAVTMGKVIASEHAVRAADLGIQILGGQGYSGRTDMQRYWRDARLMLFSPISNEMARNLIAERHGLPRSF